MATAVVAMGLLGGRPRETVLDDPRPLVRWAAAIALANIDGHQAGQAVVGELVRWAGGSSRSDSRMPFLDGDLAGYASLALSQLDPGVADRAFDALLARIPCVSGLQAMPVVGEALHAAFPAGPVSAGTSYPELDDRQRRLIDVLVQAPSTWLAGNGASLVNLALLVRGYGLPDNRNALAAYQQTRP